ncbi:MAG TPA: hypothetical protein VMP67_12180 [Candidatus Limnocylindria bacterium]|nr:hypothetical protein [Candidatus Limnocylindria bacterium]
MKQVRLDENQIANELRLALARSVAQRDVPDEVIKSVSGKIAKIRPRAPIRKLDICAYGICLDYFVSPQEWREVLFGLLDGPRVRGFRVFPWGILVDDLFQIRVEHQMEELAPYVGGMEPLTVEMG